MRITTLIGGIGLAVSLGFAANVAVAGIIFGSPTTLTSTPRDAFDAADTDDYDSDIGTIFTGKAPIQDGAEGELLIGRIPADSSASRDFSGRLEVVLNRPFSVQDGPTKALHVAKLEGTWGFLKTFDVDGASYDLGLRFMDEIIQTIDGEEITRSVLKTDAANCPNCSVEEDEKDQTRATVDISFFDKEPLTLLDGDYILRSTVNLSAEYDNAKWVLDLQDEIFGPQGIGSGRDAQGFQSRLIPEPAGLALFGLGLTILAASRRRTPRRQLRNVRLRD